MTDKKEQILDAALTLFVEQGFHGTPTSKIAQEAGVATGTLFHYFKTKDDLIVALYMLLKNRMSDYAASRAAASDDLKATLKNEYFSAISWALENQQGFRFLQQFMSSPYIALVNKQTAERQSKKGMNLLRQGIKDKIIKPMPVDYMHILLSSHMFGLNQYLAVNHFSRQKQHQLINESFEMLWDMIT